MLVWVNGEFMERDQARVSVFDAGYQHAVGLFETMGAQHGVVFRATAHMERLIDSARELLLTQRLQAQALVEAVQHVVQRNELDAARVRLSVTGGDLGASTAGGRGQVDPTVVVFAQPATVYPDSFFEDGVTVTIAEGRVNPLDVMAGHKTLNYWPRVQALQLAATRQAGESLWFSVSNHLASGSVSNIFLVKGEQLLTPIARGEEVDGGLRAPVLPGITRDVILEGALELGLTVERRMLDIDDLLKADEVFLTNSSWGVLPVVKVEKELIDNGSVGKHTLALREHWIETVDRETAISLPGALE